MPTYELCLVMRSASGSASNRGLVEALKRVANHIYTAGGYIRDMESLGHRELPQRSMVHDEVKKRGIKNKDGPKKDYPFSFDFSSILKGLTSTWSATSPYQRSTLSSMRYKLRVHTCVYDDRLTKNWIWASELWDYGLILFTGGAQDTNVSPFLLEFILGNNKTRHHAHVIKFRKKN